MNTPNTLDLSKAELVYRSQERMKTLSEGNWSVREKLALTCRILFDGGHDSGLVGQITARADASGTYFTQALGKGFDEITASNSLAQAKLAGRLVGVHWTTVYRLRRKFLSNPVVSSLNPRDRGPKMGSRPLDPLVDDVIEQVVQVWLPTQRQLASTRWPVHCVMPRSVGEHSRRASRHGAP